MTEEEYRAEHAARTAERWSTITAAAVGGMLISMTYLLIIGIGEIVERLGGDPVQVGLVLLAGSCAMLPLAASRYDYWRRKRAGIRVPRATIRPRAGHGR